MREILVLVENLTETDFRLCARFVEEGSPQVTLPPVLQRASRLRWRVPSGSIAVAAEYETAGDEDGSVGNRVLVVAGLLPGEKDRLMNAVSWMTGSSSTLPHFKAEILDRSPKGPRSDLKRALVEALPVKGYESGVGVEWMPVRASADELEIRLRLMPREPPAAQQPRLLKRATTTLVGAVGGGEAQSADEAEIQRMAGYRKIVAALNKQAALMELQADAEPMNLSRLRDLPEKVRVDLLLLVLGTLLRRRQQALDQWRSSLSEQEPIERGETNAGRELIRAISTVRESVGLGGNQAREEEEASRFSAVLSDHAEHVHLALGPLLGFDQGEKRLKVAKLIDAYIRCEPGCEPELPDLSALSVEVRLALEEAGEDSPSDACLPPFSVERCLPLGSEHVAACFVKRASSLDMDLCPSIEAVVERLNSESRTCPEDCCLAYLADSDFYTALCRDGKPAAYGAFYREGRLESALEQLGVASEAELAKTEEVHEKLERLEDMIEGKNEKSGVDATEEGSAPRRPPPIPRAWLAARDLLAVLLGAGDGAFDARSRAAFLELFTRLGVPPRLVVRWEAEIGGALFEALETSNIVATQNESQKTWNRGKVALAAAGGGLLLAVTGGLAAPAVAAGVSAIGSTATAAGAALGLAQAGAVLGATFVGWGAALASLGTAGAAVLFGATGAGITGWKLSKRWADLEEFSFVPLSRSTRMVHSSVDICNPAVVQQLDAAFRHGGGRLSEDLVVENSLGTPVALPRGTAVVHSGFLPHASAGAVSSSSGSRSNGRGYERKISDRLSDLVVGSKKAPAGTTVRYELQREVDKIQRSVHLAVFVSGWVQTELDFTRPWADAARLFFPSSGHLTLRWESRQLIELGAVFGQMVAQEVASSTASFWLKTSAAAGAATSLAAMTVTWPVWIISAMANLDNTWLVCIERARVAGRCLAHALADRQTVGQRPVTLVGHSIGARLLVYCLLELYKMGEFHAVDDVVLLGTPVTTRESKWQKVRAVVSGRVVNGYLQSDWVLAFLYRYLEWGLSVAGLTEVQVAGVENVNLSGLGIAGHHDYPRHVQDILARMKIGERGAPAI